MGKKRDRFRKMRKKRKNEKKKMNLSWKDWIRKKNPTMAKKKLRKKMRKKRDPIKKTRKKKERITEVLVEILDIDKKKRLKNMENN